MLVKLYELPASGPLLAGLRERDVTCRGAEAYERSTVLAFVKAHFPHWADEVIAGFATVPPKVVIATSGGSVLGFACFDCTRPNYFGPTGVALEHRGRGIGEALLLLALEGLAAEGYAYAIIGGVGPAAFYEKAVGATIIPGSSPGIYRDPIASEPVS